MIHLGKMRGQGRPPPRTSLSQIAWSWLGVAIGIGAIAALSSGTGAQLLIAPFGATCALAFGLPESPLAQPRSIIGGHLVSTLVGLVFLHACGSSPAAMALAVATAIAVMQLTRVLHAPAGANPIVVMMAGADWQFLVETVLPGSLVLVLAALVVNNLSGERRYPAYWF